MRVAKLEAAFPVNPWAKRVSTLGLDREPQIGSDQ